MQGACYANLVFLKIFAKGFCENPFGNSKYVN